MKMIQQNLTTWNNISVLMQKSAKQTKRIIIPHSKSILEQQVQTPSWSNTKHNNYPYIPNPPQYGNREQIVYSRTKQTVVQTVKAPKISRLDELLSRNEVIYKNLRHRLQEISRSDRNIDANINNMKPLYYQQHQQEGNQYQRQDAEQEPLQYRKSENFSIREDDPENKQYYRDSQEGIQRQSNNTFTQGQSSYKQPFTFSQSKLKNSNQSQQVNQSRARKNKNQIYMNQNSQTMEQGQAQTPAQTSQSSNTTETKRKVISNIGKRSRTEEGYHQMKKQFNRVEKVQQNKIGSYHQPDSSPIGSQFYVSGNVPYNKINRREAHSNISKNVAEESAKTKQIGRQSRGRQNDKQESNSYNTFDEQDLKNSQFSGKSGKQQKMRIIIKEPFSRQNTDNSQKIYIQKPIEQQQEDDQPAQQPRQKLKQNSFRIQIPQDLFSPSPQAQFIQVPPQQSLIFIPFNKLYSSPILQLSNKRQLTLCRKSKTQSTINNHTNRIINGIKYKNMNLVHEQIKLYEDVINHVRRVQNVLKNNFDVMRNYNSSETYDEKNEDEMTRKQSVDVLIIGGQNCLKKKLHFGLIAHIYADVIQSIDDLLQQEMNNRSKQALSITLGIQHQQQQSQGDPYMIKYEGVISREQVDNEIVYANVRAAIQQIFGCMKMKLNNGTGGQSVQEQDENVSGNRRGDGKCHRIRVTKFYLKQNNSTNSSGGNNRQPNNIYYDDNRSNYSHVSGSRYGQGLNMNMNMNRMSMNRSSMGRQSTGSDIIYGSKIISTNKVSKQLIHSLEVDSVIWCMNPLFKHYNQTKHALDEHQHYRAMLNGNR